jgi:predicted transcriptional regulator YheO
MATTSSISWTGTVVPACAAVAALLHPHGEVVLHDLASDTIVGIWNPVSGRTIGDPSLLEELPDRWDRVPVQGPYAKVTADGRPVSAVSAVVADGDGVARGLLCVNLDRSPLEGAAELLRAFAAPVVPRPPELFRRDWRERIALVVDEECRARGVARERLGRDGRREVVAALDGQGLFATRGAAEHAGRALGVSRATIYALLREARA